MLSFITDRWSWMLHWNAQLGNKTENSNFILVIKKAELPGAFKADTTI